MKQLILGILVLGASFAGGGILDGKIPASFVEAGVGVREEPNGERVTLTATGTAEIPFVRWYGDVAEDEATNPTITVSSDASVYPYFRKNWTFAGGALTDGYWSIPAQAADQALTVTGGSGVALGDGLTEACPMLDFAKPVDDDCVIKSFGVGALSYDACRKYIRYLTLPETLETINQFFLAGQKELVSVEPLFPNSLVEFLTVKDRKYLRNCLLKGVGKTKTVDLSAPGLSVIPTQVICNDGSGTELSLDTVILGGNVSTIQIAAFDYLNNAVSASAFTVVFLGDKPSSIDGAWVRNMNLPIRIVVPDDNPGWEVFAKGLTDLDDAAKTDFETRYPDGRADRVLGVGYLQGIKCYVEKLSLHDMHFLKVEGDPAEAVGDGIQWRYGYRRFEPGATVVYTAPETASGDGGEWVYAGYDVYQTQADGSWGEPVESGDATRRTVELTQRSVGSTRLVWKWVQSRVDVTLGFVPPDRSVTFQPEGGSYSIGETVTVTAQGDGFVRWYGDVPAGEEFNPTFTVQMDRPLNLIPYYRTSWTYADGRLSDGYWKVACSANGTRLTATGLAYGDGVRPMTGVSAPLDLAKPIADGHALVAIGKEAFKLANAPVIHRLTLPESLEEVGSEFLTDQSELISIEPLFPSGIQAFPNGGPILRDTLFSTVGRTKVLDLSDSALTEIPTQLFLQKAGSISSIDTAILGKNVAKINIAAFDYLDNINAAAEKVYAPAFTVKFLGDKPAVLHAQWVRQMITPLRIVIPSEMPGWRSFIGPNGNGNELPGLTADQLADFKNRYPDGDASRLLGVAKLGNSDCYVESLFMHDMNKLDIVGDPVEAVADGQTWQYGLRSLTAGESVECTAPEKAIADGEYLYDGYELHRSTEAGGWELVASGDASQRTVVFTPAETGSWRLVWKWQKNAIKLEIPALAQGGVTVRKDDAIVSPDAWSFEPGSVVSITAGVPGDNFVRWYGASVPAESVSNRTIEVVMTGFPEILPYFRHDWTYADGVLSDGYWNVACTADGNGLTVSGNALSYADEALAEYPSVALELHKPISSGRSIVALGANAFDVTVGCPELSFITLPDTLESVGAKAFFAQKNLESVEPFLPASVTTFVRYSLNGISFPNNSRMTKVDLSGKGLTALPMQLFRNEDANLGYGSVDCSIDEILLGPNVATVDNYFYDGKTPRLTIRFMGGKPEFTRDDHYARYVTQIRLFVPQDDASWDGYLSACTPATDEQKKTYSETWTTDEDQKAFNKLVGMHAFGSGKMAYVLRWRPKQNGMKIILR